MKKNKKKIILIFALLLLAVLATILVLHFSGNNSTSAPSASSYTKGEPATSTNAKDTSSSSQNSATTTQPGDEKSNPGSSDQSVALQAPSGDFVSNHHPNLSGSPAPATLTSVCTTTPGATCTITFTKDGSTKQLASQQTDRGGSTYWNNWNIHNLGLSAGEWSVSATASLGSQTLTTRDALLLEVSQ